MELNKQFDPKDWFKTNKSEREKPIPILKRLIDNYGFTLKDIYDLMKLRAYESIQRHRDYGQKPGYVWNLEGGINVI